MKKILFPLLLCTCCLFCGCITGNVVSHSASSSLAIWDFDGTIIKGDCSEGLALNGTTIYEGIARRAILAGFSSKYRGAQGADQFFQEYFAKIKQGNSMEAYRDLGRIFAGANAADLAEFCEKCFDDLKRYYFVYSVETLKHLQKANVENHIISASCEILVQGAAKSLGLPKENIHGIKLRIKDGRLTDEILEPFPYGPGKVQIMRAIEEKARKRALYGFGNSYGTDGPFLLAIAKQGGKSIMLNGGTPRPGMTEYFTCLKQTKTIQDAGK